MSDSEESVSNGSHLDIPIDKSTSILNTSADSSSSPAVTSRRPIAESRSPSTPKKERKEIKKPVKRSTPKSDIPNLYTVGCIIMTGIVLFYTFYNLRVTETTAHKLQFNYTMFSESINDMQESFPKQSHRGWVVIKTAVKASLHHPKPTSPAVLLFASDASARGTSACLVRKISRVIETLTTNSDLVQRIDCQTYAKMSVADTKKDLEEKLSEGLKEDMRVIIIDSIEKLPAFASQLLYGFCDNIHAPRNSMVYLLTLNLPNYFEKNGTADEIVENFLYEQWHELGTDQLNPLMSRIANSVVAVNPDRTC
ncbi:PREDICTED: torsin-1A-interacting protein 2-like [Priapulus caudatus]|uniref:Torsin-1A-interacting protein 2-like n=1 Tax=Priapulus caudatus TaxID=37621 RepID=A0ABM1F8Y0_PRICU|nr:PREDICTED: torsin-1A-interacting protein 2-like [Priapulus caudatus]